MKMKAIILTKSAMKKHGKRGACTTALDLDSRKVVRFVSEEDGAPIPKNVAEKYELLDIVEVEIVKKCPLGPQTENLLVQTETFRVVNQYKDGIQGILNLRKQNDSKEPQYLDDSSYKLSNVQKFHHSLEIITVYNFQINRDSRRDGEHSGKVSFDYKGKRYTNYSITDMNYDIRGRGIQSLWLGEATIVVSIPTENYQGFGYFKFIAAVYPNSGKQKITYLANFNETLTHSKTMVSAAYTADDCQSFSISGLPFGKEYNVAPLVRSFTCVLKNILQRAPVVEPSVYIQKNAQSRDLGRIIRYQFALLLMLENGILNFDVDEWKFNVSDVNVFLLAVNDLFLWYRNLYSLKGEKFHEPEVLIGNDAFTYSIDFGHNENPGSILIEDDLLDNDYYVVSTADPINYRIPIAIPEDRLNAMFFLLNNIFGYDGFNPGQLQIMTNILNLRKTIGVLPTGGGKSLCYQFAAILQPAISFAVCPLTSLELDQKDNLDNLGLTRTNLIAGFQTAVEKAAILNEFGQGKYQLIWISPERFQSEDFRKQVAKIYKERRVAYSIIDEVHCLSEWGHDFRTSYLTLIPTIEELCPQTVIVGLTATASQAVLNDLKIEFNIDSSGVKALPSLKRENLTMHVVNTAKLTRKKDDTLAELLSDKSMVNPNTVGLIFTLYKDHSDDPLPKPSSFKLKNKLEIWHPELRVARYHGSVDDKEKLDIQERFKNNEINILSTTKAFGMGINKDDVRYTIHYELPWSIESFYQEAGRAGRGVHKYPADCYIVYTPEESNIHRETDLLFERDTTPQQIAVFQGKHKADLNDVGKILFLWSNNNQGVEADIDSVAELVKRYNESSIAMEADGRFTCILHADPGYDGFTSDKMEKSLYRMKLLEFVDDWTIQWNPKAGDNFRVYFKKDYSEKICRDAFFTYIRRYDSSFGRPWVKDTLKYKDIIDRETSTRFLRKYAEALISWTYDHIIYTHRRMVYNIKNYCETYTTPEDFRNRIDSFLRISESSVLLDGIIENQSVDAWSTWFEVFYQTDNVEGTLVRRELSEDGYAALHESVARYLESYKTVTGLNLIYILTGTVSGRYSIGVDTNLMESCAEDFDTRYSEKREEILAKVLEFLQNHRDLIADDSFEDIIGCIVRQMPEKAEEYYEKYGDETSLAILIMAANQDIKFAMEGLKDGKTR